MLKEKIVTPIEAKKVKKYKYKKNIIIKRIS